MVNDLYLIAGLAFFSIFLLTFGVLYLMSTRNRRLKARLAGLQGKERSSAHDAALGRTLAKRSLDAVGADTDDISDTRYWMARAGYFEPQSVFDYYWIRLIATILFGLGGLTAGMLLHYPLVFVGVTTLVGALIGSFLPKLWVQQRIIKRAQEIKRAVPNMLDLLVVCVEAGLSISAAIQRLAVETKTTCRALSDELHIVTQEILIGKSKSESFQNLAERTGVDDLASLAVTLSQAEKLGTSIAKSLRQLADNMRFKRRQNAEERANKTSVKLVFPLVFLIFPELLVVLVGPAAINFFDVLKDVAGK